MADLRIQLEDYRLTTAQIFYGMPDAPKLLQSYVWQDYDLQPDYPVLRRFLGFWVRELDGPLHSVYVASAALVTPGDLHTVGCYLALDRQSGQ